MLSGSESPAVCVRRRLRRRGSIGVSVPNPDRSRSDAANLATALALTAPWGQRAPAATRARSFSRRVCRALILMSTFAAHKSSCFEIVGRQMLRASQALLCA